MLFIIFLINPIFFVIYEIINLKNFLNLNKRREVLFSLSLSIINTYIPYNAGDSIRYAFRYYQFRLFDFNEAYNRLVPLTDKLYYNALFIFSRIGVPYNLFIIANNFLIVMIIFSILKKYIHTKNRLFYFILLYGPISIALGLRFTLAIYIILYSILCISSYKRKLFFWMLSVFIHKLSIILIIIFILTKILYKHINKFNVYFISIIFIVIGLIFYFSIDILYDYFTQNDLIRRTKIYKDMGWDAYKALFDTKFSLINILHIFSFFISYITLFMIRIKNKDFNYIFMLILGNIIIAFLPFSHILSRFSWVFHIYFIIFISKLKNKNSLILHLFYSVRLLFFLLNVIIIFYWSTIFYINKYNATPIYFYPTFLQIIGYDNAYNKKVENIAFLKEEEHINLSRNNIMADLEKYYNNNEEN